MGGKKGKASETLPLRVAMREANWKIYIHGFNGVIPTAKDDRTHYDSVREHYMRSFSNPRVYGSQRSEHWSRAISGLTENWQQFSRLTIFPLLSVRCSGGTTSEEASVTSGTKRKDPEVSDIVDDFCTDPQMFVLARYLQAEASETINMTAWGST